MNRNTDSSIVRLTQDTTNAEMDSLGVHGENHDFSEADGGNRTQCKFCSTSQLSLAGDLFSGEANPLDHYQFLHEECSTCRPSDDSETQLCDFCRHIRLRHLCDCRSELQVDIFAKCFRLNLEVNFGGVDAISSRQNCGLCRLVADTVLIHGQEVPEGSRCSVPSFATLCIFLYKHSRTNLYIKSNLLKGAMEIVGEDLRPLPSVPHKIGMGVILQAPSGEGIPWNRIRRSLPDIKPSPIGSLPSQFRLIHVLQRRCIPVGSSFDGAFAALSYVWGSAIGVGQASPAVDLHNPPHTIEDALQACKELGQDYLWVDQICIKQDDPVDKANQIASMAAIYSSASLVIVAARGESVHSGLSGMHLARRNLRARESFLDFEFASVPNFDRDISGSIWSTRGWTLQEVALVKIKVYFSSTGVWLQYNENGKEFMYSVDFNQCMDTGLVHNSTPFYTFSKHLREYTPRKLTYEYDIYNAFSGIMTALFGGPDTNIYGLPEQHFDRALLWAPSEEEPPPSIRVFQNTPGRDPVLNPLLPTWSWASVAGEVEIPRAADPNNMIPLVKWARIAPSSQPPTPTLIDEEYQVEFPWAIRTGELIECRFFLAILWSYSGFDCPSPFPPQPNDNTQTNLGNLRQRWPSPREFWCEVNSRGSRSPTYPRLDIPGLTGQDDSKIAQLQAGILLTRAQSAHVFVDPSGYFRDSEHGALIGWLYGGDRGLILRGDSPKAGVFECIAISIANGEYEVYHLFKKRCQDSGKTREDTWSDVNSWGYYRPVINVMLIGNEGSFSYRLGIGWIFLPDWIDLERVFETILLK